MKDIFKVSVVINGVNGAGRANCEQIEANDRGRCSRIEVLVKVEEIHRNLLRWSNPRKTFSQEASFVRPFVRSEASKQRPL